MPCIFTLHSTMRQQWTSKYVKNDVLFANDWLVKWGYCTFLWWSLQGCLCGWVYNAREVLLGSACLTMLQTTPGLKMTTQGCGVMHQQPWTPQMEPGWWLAWALSSTKTYLSLTMLLRLLLMEKKQTMYIPLNLLLQRLL